MFHRRKGLVTLFVSVDQLSRHANKFSSKHHART